MIQIFVWVISYLIWNDSFNLKQVFKIFLKPINKRDLVKYVLSCWQIKKKSILHLYTTVFSIISLYELQDNQLLILFNVILHLIYFYLQWVDYSY